MEIQVALLLEDEEDDDFLMSLSRRDKRPRKEIETRDRYRYLTLDTTVSRFVLVNHSLTTDDDKTNVGVNVIENGTSRTDPSIIEDAFLDTFTLIRKYGYPCEIHKAYTEDKYILELHRVPHGRNKTSAERLPVVFLQHGLLSSSAEWVLMKPGKGLAYILADAGYDVWMGNARGNTYSRNHVSMNPTRSNFWQFSWHEIGYYDLPAMIDYTLKETGVSKIQYIGFSQGTTAFWVMSSMRPEYNEKITAMHALAPIAFMGNVRSPLIKAIAPFTNSLERVLKLLGANEFLPNGIVNELAGELLCVQEAATQILCKNLLFLICGFDNEQLNDYVFEHHIGSKKFNILLPSVNVCTINILRRIIQKNYPERSKRTTQQQTYISFTLCRFKHLLYIVLKIRFPVDLKVHNVDLYGIMYIIKYTNVRTMLPVVLGHTPAGASTRQIVHFGQLYKSKKFLQFNHGWLKNLLIYGSGSPPEYNLTAVTTPVFLHYADNDWLSTADDVEKLMIDLPAVVGKYRVPLKSFNHLDFVFANDAKKLIYDRLLNIMFRFTN
ncbi:unnamed protein product [Parnassius apollo]|uniref:(apollo) hypothetical protein n=1 Tax=Parnassius apollo TaxID=110799 RepID=A0A8S3YD80_PARAO|nr:unnamed protein product [Parnassius apollo]